MVLTGRGLGYQARPGQPVDESEVVRVFVLDDNRDTDNFAAMLASIAPEHVQRGLEGMFPLRAEVSHLYPRELLWAEKMVAAINEELDTQLPADEAVPIALHLVNAAFNQGNLALTYRMTGIFSQIFDMIESAFGEPLDRNFVNVARFITHLRYFFVRVHSHEQLGDDPPRTPRLGLNPEGLDGAGSLASGPLLLLRGESLPTSRELTGCVGRDGPTVTPLGRRCLIVTDAPG